MAKVLIFAPKFRPTGGSPGNPGFYTVTASGSHFVINLQNGFQQVIQLTAAMATSGATNMTINVPIWTGGTIVAGIPKLSLYVIQATTPGNIPCPNFVVTGTGSWSLDFPNASLAGVNEIDGTPQSANFFEAHFHSNNKWLLDNFSPGRSLS